MRCLYCGQTASVRIPSQGDAVCVAHAIEFWTGLLAYIKGLSEMSEPRDAGCRCPSCNELSAARMRSSAVPAAAPASGRASM